MSLVQTNKKLNMIVSEIPELIYTCSIFPLFTKNHLYLTIDEKNIKSTLV